MPAKSTKRFNPAPIRRRLLERGLTYKALAYRVGKSPSTISYLMRGETAHPATVWVVCAELGIDPRTVWR